LGKKPRSHSTRRWLKVKRISRLAKFSRMLKLLAIFGGGV
jgi:hypothetical protein